MLLIIFQFLFSLHFLCLSVTFLWHITYIPIKRGFLYLTTVIDWYSRCIVGWEVDDTLDTRMVINALKKAFKTSKPVILNSDQECQFTSNEYMNFLKENQIRQNMDEKSRWRITL
ncbi:DDE-type integrase/transposase/recombinase [Lachnospiraceae bacterium EP-SM-12S-S03]|nr:DDE-type integrase/transposase/recombinase [Lachnospiraceae bacterium EP-SM-12S-S03]